MAVIVGDENDNTLVGTATADQITGAGGNDTLDGADGDDELKGNAGDDVLRGSDGNNRLFGGDGNDTLSARAGTDLFNGGGGIDTLDFSTDYQADADLLLGTNVIFIQSIGGNYYVTDQLTGIENLAGSVYHDKLSGDDGVNAIDGRAGNDFLKGPGRRGRAFRR